MTIPREEVEKAARKYSESLKIYKGDCYFIETIEDFKAGVTFAEWINSNRLTYYKNGTTTPSWFDSDMHSLDCNTAELFEQFIKDKSHEN